MDFLQPTSLRAALEAKAERPEALPIAGGTDVMVELNFDRGRRALPLADFVTGPKQNALADDELIVGVRVRPAVGPQTFMKVGPRNAMVISVVSLALAVDGDELRVSFGSAGPVPGLVALAVDDAAELPELVAAAASPIDDVRGTAAYRRHALRVLASRALDRCLA